MGMSTRRPLVGYVVKLALRQKRTDCKSAVSDSNQRKLPCVHVSGSKTGDLAATARNSCGWSTQSPVILTSSSYKMLEEAPLAPRQDSCQVIWPTTPSHAQRFLQSRRRGVQLCSLDLLTLLCDTP
jgi:hypothetical protein